MRLLLTILLFNVNAYAQSDTARWVFSNDDSVLRYDVLYGIDSNHMVTDTSLAQGTKQYQFPNTTGWFKIVAVGPGTSSPTVFLSFDVATITSAKLNPTTLAWTTTNEQNVKWFLIEKSNGRNWTMTTQQPPKGPGSYSYRFARTIVRYTYRVSAVFKDATKGIPITFK